MKSKGFILLDALVSVFIVMAMSAITVNIWQSYQHYQHNFEEYKEETNERYYEILGGLSYCEKCVIEEDEDSLPSEP